MGEDKGRRYDPMRRWGQVGIDFEPTEYFYVREGAARVHKYPTEEWFWRGTNFGRGLLRTRANTSYTDPMPISLTYLFVKCVNDLLAAVSTSKSGYSYQSWPLIRGGFEAAELMDYLCHHPQDTEKWINKEKRFDSLSWLRNDLPHTNLRRRLYDTINDLTHANLRPIDAFGTLRSDDKATKYLVVGPNPYPIEGSNPIDVASSFISYPTRVLWRSDPGVMDSDWVARFHSFETQAKFPFGEAWNP